MSGIAALRRELDAASKLREAGAYVEKLNALRDQFEHQVSILPDGRERMNRFNCFAYALGLWDHPDYVQLVDAKSDSAVINSNTIAEMLSEGALVEIDPHEAKANDMVVYFDNGKVTHAAALSDKGVFRSKWGGNEVHAHGLWEVPASYGNVVRYFRRPASEAVFRRLDMTRGSR
jgi:hypothetical protein